MTVLITGGAGFIGSNFIVEWLKQSDEMVINLDKLTYAGNICNLNCVELDERHLFVRGDIGDKLLVEEIFKKHKPRAVINFAAESHVDRSICSPEEFIQTNIVGTYRLLDTVRNYWSELSTEKKERFRFLHVSTDEVYGSLTSEEPPFSESNRYQPNSPYSASKASSDHLVRAYYHTYGLPVLTTNCSNNYGPYQFPEKLIPLIIHNAIEQKSIPIYGDGLQIRDWLFVSDHCDAIRTVLAAGSRGEVYNIGGLNEKTNLQIAYTICDILSDLCPLGASEDIADYRSLIKFVRDRPGHDRRYAINAIKIESELGWKPRESFESGVLKTVKWYLENQGWVSGIVSGEYRNWVRRQYA